MQPIKIAVIGAGYWGPNLVRNFYELPEADLRIVCDRDRERLDHIKSRYPEVRTVQDHREVLESDVEAVAIATPVSTHHRLALDCLRAGKHVLVEKPLALNSPDARDIIAAGREVNRVVMTGHTFVYNPAVVALRELIAGGEIGEVFYINSARVNLGLYQPDINVVWDLAPHDISILLYVLGVEPESVSARGGQFARYGVHDVAYLTLYYPGGAMADLRLSWLDPCKIRRITIVGSRKMIVYDDIAQDDKLVIYDKGVDVQPYTDTYEEFHLAYRYGDGVTYPLDWVEPLRLECLDFLMCVREGRASRSGGESGLQVVQVLEAAHKSLFNGHTMEPIAW